MIMAAGNDAGASPIYPAAYASSWGMAIGAVDSNGFMASFSNRSGSSVLDYVTAAGVSVTSTTPNNNYATYSGTSMATPHMAGAMALLMQANLSSGRNLSVGQLEQLFTASASNSPAPTATSSTAAVSGINPASAMSGSATPSTAAPVVGPLAAPEGFTSGAGSSGAAKAHGSVKNPFTGSAEAELASLFKAETSPPGSSPSSSPSSQDVAIGAAIPRGGSGQISGTGTLEAFVADLFTNSPALSRRDGPGAVDPLTNLWDLFGTSPRVRETG